jgi:cupin 2 domain-containing protein
MSGKTRPVKKENLQSGVPASMRAEFVERIAWQKGVRIERIVSRGHCSAAGFWYDQAETEWVLLVQGAARIRFEATDEVIEMGPGDHITIPPRARHRVEWTPSDTETIWLAVFY